MFDTELELIKSMYGDRCAERSGVPLMNHITEGVTIMRDRNFQNLSIRAFIVHPLFQNDDALENYGLHIVSQLNPFVVVLAMEYRRVANSWLSHMKKPKPILWGPFDIYMREMLFADKIQNYKDFLLYHQNHERAPQLKRYFKSWLKELDYRPGLTF